MKIKLLTLLAVLLALFAPDVQAAPPGSGWTLTYDKEFTTMPTICSTPSKPVPGMLPCDSWNSHFYNSDQQYYCFPGVDTGFNPFSVTLNSEGVNSFNITLDKTPSGMNTQSHIYVSGCVSTAAGSDYQGKIQSSTPFGQTYGYYEIRAKLPTGQGPGYWPAFWLMPYNPGNPDANSTVAEYDIFEVLGGKPTVINQTVHWGSYAHQTSVAYQGPDTSAGFHTYGFEWDATNIRWYVDGVLANTQPNEYNLPMYVILSVGIGGPGSWGGPATAATTFPGLFQIEYLRVYANGSVSTSSTGTTTQTLSSFPASMNLSTTSSPYTLPATTSAGLTPTYTVASGPATVSGNTLTLTGAGTVVVKASQAGNATYAALSATETITVTAPSLATQTISNFPATLSLTTAASAHTLTAATSAGLTISYSVSSGPATVSGDTLNLTGAGTVMVKATQAGNSTYAALSATETITVTAPSLATQTISNFPATQALTLGASPITLPDTTSAGLTLSYSVTSGPATVSGNTLTLTGAGTVVLKATQAGNSTYAAFSATETITVTTPAAAQTQTVSNFPTTQSLTNNGVTTTLPATTSAGLAITYTVVSGPATISGNTLTVTGAGTVVIRATQAGNGSYASYTSTETITVSAGTTVTFAQWEALPGHFTPADMANSAISGPTASPQNDGVPNLLKYLYNIDPSGPMSTADNGAMPASDTDSTTTPGTTYLTLTYRRYAQVTGITVNVQTSPDLQTWTTVTPAINRKIGVDAHTGDPIMEVEVNTRGASSEFIRLNVTSP